LRNPYEPSVYTKNHATRLGFPSKHTLALLPPAFKIPKREFEHLEPWEATEHNGIAILTRTDPNEAKIMAEVRGLWYEPKKRATGGRKQKRGLYWAILRQRRGPLRTAIDKVLVSQVLEGNPDAWVELVQRFWPGLYRFLLGGRHARQAIDAEDICSLTFDEVKRDLAKFAWRSKLGTWVYSIGANQALKFYTTNRQHETLYDYANPNAVTYDEAENLDGIDPNTGQPLRLDDGQRWNFAEDSDPGPKVDTAPSFKRCKRPNPEQKLLRKELREVVAGHVGKLTEPQQDVIDYRYWHGRIDTITRNGDTVELYRDGLRYKQIGERMQTRERAAISTHNRAVEALRDAMKQDPYFKGRPGPLPPRQNLTHERVCMRAMREIVDQFERWCEHFCT
jgi:RNA polymerase sigma factor (sigma-70 family)